jgi:hypothetical protein
VAPRRGGVGHRVGGDGNAKLGVEVCSEGVRQ